MGTGVSPVGPDVQYGLGTGPDGLQFRHHGVWADKKWDLALELEADRFDMQLDDDLDLEEEEALRLLEDAHGLPVGTLQNNDFEDELLVDEL